MVNPSPTDSNTHRLRSLRSILSQLDYEIDEGECESIFLSKVRHFADNYVPDDNVPGRDLLKLHRQQDDISKMVVAFLVRHGKTFWPYYNDPEPLQYCNTDRAQRFV